MKKSTLFVAAGLLIGNRRSPDTVALIPVEVQESEVLEFAAGGFGKQRAQGLPGDRPSAQPGDDRVAVQLEPRHRHANVSGQDAANPDGEALFEHDDAVCVLQRGTHVVKRERAVRSDSQDNPTVCFLYLLQRWSGCCRSSHRPAISALLLDVVVP